MIFDTRPDLYLRYHAIHILSKVEKGSARWCKLRQTNPQDMRMCVCVCCFMYESGVWSVMHVLGVIFLCGRRHLFLAIFFVERTRSIEIKLFASLAESTRADSCRSLLSKANNTICSHCLVYVVQTASLFVCFQSSAFSVLCVVCFVLLVFWSFDVLYILGHLIIANRCILLLTLSTYCNSLWACLVSPLWRRRQRSAQIGDDIRGC